MYVCINILNLAHAAQGAATNAEQHEFGSRLTNNKSNAWTIQQSTRGYIYSDAWSLFFVWVIVGKNLTNDFSNLIAWTIAQMIAQTIAQMIKQLINQLTNLYTNHTLNYWSIDHLFQRICVAINDDVYHHWWPQNGLTAHTVNLSEVDGASNMHAMPWYAQIDEKISFSIFLDFFSFSQDWFWEWNKKGKYLGF